MRLSVNLLFQFVPKHLPVSTEGVELLQEFIQQSSKIFILTGAGLSTESGIPDYRSEGVGLYSRSNHRPMKIQEFVSSTECRKRYWARNYMVTQNVDGLHKKAESRNVVELHGTGFLNRNPHMSISSLKSTPSSSEVRPDGDIYLEEADAINFDVPGCPSCSTGILQPNIVFFGDNVKKEKVDYLYGELAKCDSFLVLGSSLQVFSSFRFVLRAKEMNIPIAIVTLGPTRGDKFAKLIENSRLGDILPKIII